MPDIRDEIAECFLAQRFKQQPIGVSAVLDTLEQTVFRTINAWKFCPVCDGKASDAEAILHHIRTQHRESPADDQPDQEMPCIECGGKPNVVSGAGDFFHAVCENAECHSCGALRQSSEEAMKAWNTRMLCALTMGKHGDDERSLESVSRHIAVSLWNAKIVKVLDDSLVAAISRSIRGKFGEDDE